MTNVTLYNTRVRKKEPFAPLNPGKPTMYVCGPTVYDKAHLGNARAMVVYDVLFRILRHHYGDDAVTYIRNITDVDDKINAAAKAQQISIGELTTRTTKAFHEDMALLGCLSPTKEPRATDHIAEMISVITKLIKNGHAYAAEGHVLFSVKACESYGTLSNRTLEEMEAGARIESAPYKKNPEDFVLWKPSLEGEPQWESPWGNGRPGWHIECTAMSTTYLGETFDIHGGGVDLIFPHHENETAQALCAHKGSDYAKCWVHNGFLKVNGEKMSKSLGNFLTPDDLMQNTPSKIIAGEAIRYVLLSAHYRKPLNWNDTLYKDALSHVTRFYQTARMCLEASCAVMPANAEIINALSQDMNTPAAFALLLALEKKARKTPEDGGEFIASLTLCGFIGHSPLSVLDEMNSDMLDSVDIEWIEKRISERTEAKKNKDWSAADALRHMLTEHGIVLKDCKDGSTEWSRTLATTSELK